MEYQDASCTRDLNRGDFGGLVQERMRGSRGCIGAPDLTAPAPVN